MKIGSASLFGKLCCGLSMAALALAVSLDGSRAVRAEDADDLTTSLQQMIVDPVMKTVQGLEARLSGLEATVGAMSDSFNSRRVAAQLLCVSDETGAQTCITKAQLDTLLSGIARAEISKPSVAVTEAKAAPTEEPVETIVSKDVPKDPSRYLAPNGAPEEKPVADEEPGHTGTIQSASSGPAIVLTPEVEVTEDPIPAQAFPAEPAPVQATPSEPDEQSDN
jgi:TolA-binding protein